MQLVPPIAARAATKFSELVVCRALLAISYRLTAQNFSAKCEEVTDKDSTRANFSATGSGNNYELSNYI